MEKIFNYKLNYGGVIFEYTDSPDFSEREIHSYHEILFLKGKKVTLRTENRRIELFGDCLVIIPRGCYHYFDTAGQKRFPRLKISISNELASSLPVSLFSSPLSVVYTEKKSWGALAGGLCEAVKENCEGESGFYAYSAAMMLIAELDRGKAVSQESYQSNNEAIVTAVKYIAKNLSGDLSTGKIAKEINASPSFLTHKFKSEMGISLHRYVVGKRMIYAGERIGAGDNPTKIYRDCGFSDYSSFYKAYCRFFGSAPTK